MRKILFLLVLSTSLAMAQGGPLVDAVKFRGEVTTTVRNTFDVPTGETWLIWNTTTEQLEIGDDAEVWSTIGGGDITKDGTQAINYVAVWSGDGTLSGNNGFTYNLSTGAMYTLDSRFELQTAKNGVFLGQNSGQVEGASSSYNTGLGQLSMQNSVNGARNSGLGAYSLEKIQAADDNIGVGYESGAYITGGSTSNLTPSNSIYIGNYTRPAADGETNQIVIGDQVTGNGSNTVTIGNSSVTDNYFNGTINVDDLLLTPTDTEPTGTEGAVYFDDSENTLKQYNGTSWEAFGGADNSLSETDQTILAAITRTVDLSTNANLHIDVANTGSSFRLQDNATDVLRLISGGNLEILTNLAVSGLVDGRDIAADGATLDGTVQGTISGRTGTTVTEVMVQTQAQYDTDGAPSAGEVVFISDAVDTLYISVPLSDFSTVQTASTTVAKYTWRAPHAMTLKDIRGSVATAGTTSSITMDVHDGATTIMTTNKVVIEATETTSEDATTQPTLTDTAIADDAILTFYIDGVDSGGTGLGYEVKLYYVKP